MSTAKEEILRILESLPEDASREEIHKHLEAARDQFDRRISRDGIELFQGETAEFDGKVNVPGTLEIAQYEGLGLFWDYDPGGIFSLHLTWGSKTSEPVLRIPLTKDEMKIVHGYREKGGWGYYDLMVEKDDDRALIQVSFISAKNGPTSLLWFVDRQRRDAIRRGIDRFRADPLFGDD